MNLVLLLFIALFYKHGKIEYKLCEEKLHKKLKDLPNANNAISQTYHYYNPLF